MPSELHAERRDSALVLTLSHPESRNSLTDQVFAAGVEALETSEMDDGVRCIVIRGEGEHFSSGGNLQRIQANRGNGREAQDSMLAHFHDFIDAVRVFPKPVIAAVEGVAAGGGFSLALACDLIVAAEDATFDPAYGRLGLSPDGGMSWQLMQRLPRGLVLQMLWLSEPMAARQLHAHGAVNWLCGHGEALGVALDIASRLAGCAPGAVASVKELANQWPMTGLAEQLAAERIHFLDNLFHANGAEGLQSFLDRRAPRFE